MLLVTTALEETWGEEGKLILLGEWCRLYSRKEILSKRSYSIATYHWDDRQKAYNDSKYLQSLNKKIIHELVPILNNLHGVNFSERSWNLLIGNWLIQFTAVIFDRWIMIDKIAKSSYSIETIVIDDYNKRVVPNNINEALFLFQNDYWNHVVYGEIISKCSNIKIKRTTKPKLTINQYILFSPKVTSVKKVFVKKILSKCFGFLTRNNSYVFAPFELRILDIFKLQILLRQLPGNIKFPNTPNVKFDSGFRKWKLTSSKKTEDFESIVRIMIPKYMPKAYLEGLDSCSKLIDKIKAPGKPKVVFTDVAHLVDDMFKVWLMKHLEGGTRLVTAQHGGGAFHKFNGTMLFDRQIPDVYLSTGYGNAISEKIKPVGQLFSRIKYNDYNANGDAVLVTIAMPRYSFDLRSMVIGGQMIDYFNDQFQFYGLLPVKIQSQISIRLYHGSYGWQQKQRWVDNYPKAKFDSKNQSLSRSIQKSRLMISTYAATTYNETIAANIPTIIYWNTKHWELDDKSKPLFEELKSVGIFHETPKSAAAQVERIWNDIEGWWNEPELQKIRKKYCKAYAYRPDDLLIKVKDVLSNIV